MEKGLVAGYIMFGSGLNKRTFPNLTWDCKQTYNIIPYFEDSFITNINEDEYSLTEGWILLRAGKTYEISSRVSLVQTTGVSLCVHAINYDTNGYIAYGDTVNYAGYCSCMVSSIICPEEDTRIAFVIYRTK